MIEHYIQASGWKGGFQTLHGGVVISRLLPE